jgi:hypothetical protein
MQSSKLWLAVALVGIAACSDSSEGPLAPDQPGLAQGLGRVARVENSDDAGPGSFRAAVTAANASPAIQAIEFAFGLSPIALQQPVVFTGRQALTVEGSQTVLDGAGLAPDAPALLVTTGAGDLSLTSLTFRNAPREGLAVEVPATAKGVTRVSLSDILATGNGGHGVLINDQLDPEDTGNSGGSEASLEVTVTGSVFEANGFSTLDRDGLRVNEGGRGDLLVVLAQTRAEGNGADGVELDERGAGDVRFHVSDSEFAANGSFDQTLADLDDGFDIDESNEGSLLGTVVRSSASDNKEEGFDFNENHEGDFRVDMTFVEASRNLEEGIDFEEDDDFQGGGDLLATLAGIEANDNGSSDGDGGIKIRERGDGGLDATVRGAETTGNSESGINIREQQAGNLAARIERATATGNALSGIAVREDDEGDLIATAANGTSSDNGGAGVRADQETPGSGSLDLISMTFGNNTLGDYIANVPDVTVTQTP